MTTEYQTIFDLVMLFFHDRSKTEIWMHTPNHILGDVSPTQMIAFGRGKKLRAFVENCISENVDLSGDVS